MNRSALRSRRRLSDAGKKPPTISAHQVFSAISDKQPKCALLRLQHGKQKVMRKMWVSFYLDGTLRKIIGSGASSGFVEIATPSACLLILKNAVIRKVLPSCKKWYAIFYWNKRQYVAGGMEVLSVDRRGGKGRNRSLVAAKFRYMERIN